MFLFQDGAIVVLSILLAILLVRTDALVSFLTATKEMEVVGSFIAGLFFTSIFTTAPAIVALGEIAQANSVLLTAFAGAAGAVVGDLVLFRFVHDRFSSHFSMLIHQMGFKKKCYVFCRTKWLRWVPYVLGAIILASPLPDELGISLLGFSKLRLSWFIPVAFVSNFIGIYLIGIVARSLSS